MLSILKSHVFTIYISRKVLLSLCVAVPLFLAYIMVCHYLVSFYHVCQEIHKVQLG